jgi:glycosyltransferase involved in cell wall biosynthesis
LIIPTYNNLATLPEVLSSILMLRNLSSIELVISDDASTDGSQVYLNGWTTEHGSAFNKIRLILNETNSGISGNHARAFVEATGDYGFYIGGDDIVYNEDFIVDLERAIEASPNMRIAKVDVEALLRPGNIVDRIYQNKRFFFSMSSRRQFTALSLLGNFLYAGPGTVLHLPTLREIGGFDQRFSTYEDMMLFNTFLVHGYPIKFIDLQGIYWVRASSSLSLAGFSGKRERFEDENRLRREFVSANIDKFTWFERLLLKRQVMSKWRRYPFLIVYPSWIRFRFIPSVMKKARWILNTRDQSMSKQCSGCVEEIT